MNRRSFISTITAGLAALPFVKISAMPAEVLKPPVQISDDELLNSMRAQLAEAYPDAAIRLVDMGVFNPNIFSKYVRIRIGNKDKSREHYSVQLFDARHSDGMRFFKHALRGLQRTVKNEDLR